MAGGDRQLRDNLNDPAFLNFYDLLGVSRTADGKTIGRVVRQLSRKVHPDKAGNVDAVEKLLYEAATAHLNNIKTLLCDDDAGRAVYDIELRILE